MTQDSHRLAAILLVLTFAACARVHNVLSCDSPAHNESALTSSWQQPATETDIGSIADTVYTLHRIRADDVEIPVQARGLLTRFKHQIRDLISEIINDTQASVSARSLRATIWDQLTAKGVTIGQPREHSISDYEWESKYDYGDIYDIIISKLADHPELLAVTTTIQIPCGQDSSLYLFQKHQSGWRLILAQEANGYSDVSGAQGLFEYRIVFDSSKSLFVLTANVNPWCTSAWQSIRYAVLRPGVTADNPRLITSGKETIYLGLDPPPYELVVKRKSFSIRFAGEANQAQIMAGTITRNRVSETGP